MLFVAVGLATALVYLALVAWVPLLPSNLYVPLLDLGKITGYTWASAFDYLAIVLTLYALYGVGYRLVTRNYASTLAIFALGIVFEIELLGAYPATAVDVFGYIAQGRLEAVHQANPFVVPPATYPGDAIIPFLAFPNEVAQYGPLWVYVGAGVASVAQGNLLTEIVGYKVVGALAHIAAAALTLRIAPSLGASQAQARAGAFLLLWNPLLLWEMVGNAHNDGLMMLGGLLAIWLMTRRRNLIVLPALILGALVKLPVIVIAPVLAIAVWKRSKPIAIEGFWLAVLLAALVYRPLWTGMDTLTALRRTDLFTASLGSVVRLSLEPGLGMDTATIVARWLSLGAFGLLAIASVVQAMRTNDLRQTVFLAYIIMLGAALLATTWFQAWYLVWPFAFGAALPAARRHLEVALLSLGGFMQYFVFIYLWVIGVFPPEEGLGVQLAAYIGIIGPCVLGVLLWRYARVSSQSEVTAGAD